MGRLAQARPGGLEPSCWWKTGGARAPKAVRARYLRRFGAAERECDVMRRSVPCEGNNCLRLTTGSLQRTFFVLLLHRLACLCFVPCLKRGVHVAPWQRRC